MTDTTIVTTANTPGIKGLTRSTWRDETHLRGMLLKLITQHPDATRDDLEAMYLAKAKKKRRWSMRHCGARSTMIWRACSSLLVHDIELPLREVVAVVDSIKTTVLLDFVMPSGKRLRDSTGKECRAAGGWLSDIGAVSAA